jgi:hypothetical protein
LPHNGVTIANGLIFYFSNLIMIILIFHIVPCRRYLLGLENTRLCWLHRFIYDSTSRHYNLSLHWVLIPWCLALGRSFDVFFRRLAANWLLCNLSLVTGWLYS